MRELRGVALLALAGLLACRSGDERARAAVEQLFSEDANEDALATVVDLGPVCVPHLVELIASTPQLASGLGVTALLQIGDRAVPALLRELDSDDASERVVAIQVLVWMEGQPSGEEAVRRFIECLSDQDARVRTGAAFGLVMEDQRPREAVPVLLDALAASDHGTRSNAAKFLGHYPHSVPEVVGGLVKAADDALPEVQQAVLDSLAGYWSADPRAATRIRETLSSDKPNERVAALRALVRVEAPNPEVRKLCLAAAEDEDEDVRTAALESLRAISGEGVR